VGKCPLQNSVDCENVLYHKIIIVKWSNEKTVEYGLGKT
jgi:hypothetical protein